MTPEEAADFYEDDEDPAEVFAAYEAAVERGEVVYTVQPETAHPPRLAYFVERDKDGVWVPASPRCRDKETVSDALTACQIHYPDRTYRVVAEATLWTVLDVGD